MRLSLKDLFAIVAYLATMAWVVALVGASGQFWVFVLLSGLMSALFVCIARSERAKTYAWLVPLAVVVVCAFPSRSLALMANGAALSLAGMVLAGTATRKLRVLRAMTMCCSLIGVAVGIMSAQDSLRQLLRMREQFPIISLDSRLQYELSSTSRSTGRDSTLSVVIMQNLADVDREYQSSRFNEQRLRAIHDRHYQSLIRAAGFGATGMIRYHERPSNLPPLRDIEFDEDISSALISWNIRESAMNNANEEQHFHAVSRADFLNVEYFGAQIGPARQVTGFVPHAFHNPPQVGLGERFPWSLKRLELVSLLRFDQPRVYVLDHLPRMDQLSGPNVRTRPLDQFESEALTQLWTEEDIVTGPDGNDVRMLGALRAATRCLECHHVEHGELLGAFTYSIQRADAEADGEGR